MMQLHKIFGILQGWCDAKCLTREFSAIDGRRFVYKVSDEQIKLLIYNGASKEPDVIGEHVFNLKACTSSAGPVELDDFVRFLV